MHRTLAMLAFAVAGMPGASDAADECVAGPQFVEIPARGAAQQQVPADGWLRIEETGHTLQIDGAADVIQLPLPYRYGTMYVRSGGSIAVRGAGPGTRVSGMRVTALCNAAVPDAARERWLSDAAVVAQGAQGYPQSQNNIDEPLVRVGRLLDSARDGNDRALALHLRAQVQMVGGRSVAAANDFARAADAWSAHGDAARSRAAQVGQVEELLRLARYADVLAIVDPIPGPIADREYFAARLKLSGCLALRYLGRMDAALPCFAHGIERMQALDERVDAVSALQDMADVQRFRGDVAAARDTAQAALQAAIEPQMETQRGRIALTLSELSAREGDVEGALAWLDRSLVEFGKGNATRWEASALLSTADVYIDLGALDEASDLVDAALRRLNASDAPARVAAAQVRRARITFAAQRIDDATQQVNAIAAEFRRLAMPAELDVVQALQARLLLAAGDVAHAEQVLHARDSTQRLIANEWVLLESEIAVARGDCALAERSLAQLRGTLALAAEVRRVEVVAACMAARGRRDEAQHLLRSSAEQIVGAARQVGSNLLRQMLAPPVAELRRAAFSLRDERRGDATEVDDAWTWLRLERAARDVRTGPPSASATTFDADVARFLIAGRSTPGAPATDDTRSLLGMLTSGKAGDGAAAAFEPDPLPVLQARLAPGALFVSVVAAGPRSKLLWASHDAAGLVPVADPQAWQPAAAALTARASDTRTPLDALAADAAALASTVLPDALPDVPAQLWIDADSALAEVPWSLLAWPRSAQPLVDTTRVSLTQALLSAPSAALPVSDVRVFASEARTGHQPALFNTVAEPDLIGRVLAPHGRRALTAATEGRDALIAAFGQSTPWIHVASHGSSVATRLGYAGVWLDGTQGTAAPQFVSWLEILARGASAELVVLNACELADSSSRWLSFAEAVARAGARNVVAARWQVSDGATTTWVPAFYGALAEHGDVAEALASSQRRLRGSRNYRHPAYWSSFVHIGNP